MHSRTREKGHTSNQITQDTCHYVPTLTLLYFILYCKGWNKIYIKKNYAHCTWPNYTVHIALCTLQYAH